MHPFWIARNPLCDPANIFNHFVGKVLPTASMKTYRFIVQGRVQGVFYRKTIQESCRDLGLQGSIKNLPNGSVKVLVTLADEDLPDFVGILQQGSPNSRVDSVSQEVIEGMHLEYDSFIVKY